MAAGLELTRGANPARSVARSETARRPARLEEDERLAPELPHVDGFQRGQPVSGRHRDQHGLADQRGSLEARTT